MRRHGIADATALRHRAAHEPDWFYRAIEADLAIEWYEPYHTLCDSRRGLPWSNWFLGGRLNLTHNCLDRHIAAGFGSQCAVIAEDDQGRVTKLTYQQLNQRVQQVAAMLAELGAQVGDSVGFYLPMSAEVVVALLACFNIGAVPVPVFAGFGPEALAARLNDAAARILLTADATYRRGKLVPLKPAADRARELSNSVQRVVVLQHTGESVPFDRQHDVWWHEAEATAPEFGATVALPADARSLILYTSGTTGKPKGAVHTHAGVQYVTAKEAGYHLDLRAGDTMFWLTDIGWMMGPWEICGVLFHRGTVVLLDGSPDHPGIDRIWAMVERHRVTHLAVAPTAIRVLAAHGPDPVKQHDLTSVRILGSTGEPWDDASYQWYFDHAGSGHCPVINISGGTELMGCLLAPLCVEPLKASSLQGPALGMDVDVIDEQQRPLRGEVGYLICRNAAPNMTRGFLGDPERYLETYFAQFGPSIWSHGDWAVIDGDGHWFLMGRADDTLKIAGKRIGPAEVETAANAHSAVRESAAIGLDDPVKGTKLVLVVVLRSGQQATEELAQQIGRFVGERLGSTMRPADVRFVAALPMTRSGKIVRNVIRRVLSGQDPGSLASVANPDAVEALKGTT
jgi:acetyl-CoA synthetase